MAGVAGSITKSLSSMRHRVSILRRDGGKNDLGQVTSDFEVVADDIPARVAELNGRELERARQLVAEATYIVELRCSSVVVSPKDRLQYGSIVMAIGAATKDEVSMMQTLTCYEVKR